MNSNGNGYAASLTALENVLGFSVSVMIGEHFYSSSLSSPYTTQKLSANSPEDAKTVWKLFWEATAGNILLALILGYALRPKTGRGKFSFNMWPLIGALGISIYYYYTYSRALDGKL